MKNLLNIGIEKLEILPIDLLSLTLQKKHHRLFNHVYRRNGDTHNIHGMSMWKFIRIFIEARIGQPFDDVFSEFCKVAPKYQQKYFLTEFESKIRWYYSDDYKIDENGLIQFAREKNKYKGPYTFTSDDAMWEERHKVTGKVKPKWDWKNKHKKEDYKDVLVNGWIKSFDSKNDKEFKRLQGERIKRKRKTERCVKKEKLEISYSFISKSELEKQKDKELDRQKILSHGMDLITSFRSEKQTNPDLIKEKQ